MKALFTTKFWSILTVIGVTVVLLLSTISGYRNGQSIAQAQAIFANAKVLTTGLNYFYNDQDRYPTAGEYGSQQVMINYFKSYPPVEVPSSVCPQNFSYKRPAANSFQLSYCLPAPVGNLPAGWNTLSDQK